MNAISLSLCSPFTLPLLSSSWCGYASSIITRIYQLTVKHFSLLQNACVTGFGFKELLIDYIPQQINLNKHKNETGFSLIEKTAKKKENHLQRIQAINTEFSFVHGLLYLGTGVSGGMVAAHELQWVNLGASLPYFHYAAAGLFLYVNFYSLEQNIKLFYHADQLLNEELYQELAQRIKVSSILGIINNIAYIITTICSFIPAQEILYLVLACFSIFTGSLKIIYDFFFLNPKLSAV
jgi:hypothetical protein